jgi:hypothetical protein
VVTTVSRAEVSHHEAGHSVAALVLGLDVEVATIVPDGSRLGHVIVAVEEQGDLAYYVARSVMLWAGLLAGQRHIGAGIDEIGGDDLEQVAFYADCVAIGSGETDGFMVWTRARAMSVLNEHWSAVSAVALALLEHDTLTGDEVRAIVDDVDGAAEVVPIRSATSIGVAAAVRLAPGGSSSSAATGRGPAGGRARRALPAGPSPTVKEK